MDDHFSSSSHLTCFSQNHGRNVILLEDNTVAYRKASFANAVTVSEQPVLPGEIFLVEIEQTEPGWTGHMRLGLTQRHPTSPLPLYSIPDLSNRGDSWICAITKYHNDVRVRPRTGSRVVHPPYGGRAAGAVPHASTGEDRPFTVIEPGANNDTDVTRYQDNSAPEMPFTSTFDGLRNNHTYQDSSKATSSKNYFTKSESFLHEAPGGTDIDGVIPSLCNNTLSRTINKSSSASAVESYSRKCVLESRSVDESSSRGTEVSLSPDVVAGMSAYLPSDLVLELANCGISSCTSLVDSATKNNCFDMSCDVFISCDTNSTASGNLLENKPINSARTRSDFPSISTAGQCNGATFSHDISISFTKHNCDSDQIDVTATDLVHMSATNPMVDIATDLMHDTTSTNGLPNISNDNPCSSRLESCLAEGVGQSLGSSTSASVDTENVVPSALADESKIFPTPSYNYSVDSVEARNRPDWSYTPSLAAVRPREVLEEVYEGHVEEGDGGADEEEEYESCLTRLSLGDRLNTSRGLVPRCLLLPSARYQSATPLATDEGSRIGLLYLPQVGGYAEMHYIINGEDQGVFTRLLPYKKAPLHAVVDVYGTTKRVRIVQLYGVVSLKAACRATILQCLSPNTISMLPLPPQLLKYLLEVGPSYC